MADIEYTLYPTQQRALTTEATEILFGGSVFGGKSHLARVSAIIFCLQAPGLQVYLFRRTYKELASNHLYTPGGFLELLAPLLDAKQVVFNKSDFSFAFKNGSRIQLAHCQYETDMYTYQGAQFGYLIIDEAGTFTADMIKFLRTRARLGSMKVPPAMKGMLPRILMTANPGGVGHHYLKSGFVDFGPNVVHTAPIDDGGMDREYVPSRLTDNVMALEEDPDYVNRIRGLGDSAMVEALISGDWDILSTGGFADLWRSSTHVMEPFPIPVTWRIDRGYDYGSSAPAAALWFAEADGEDFVDSSGVECWVPKGSLFIIGEVYLADRKYKGLKLTAEEQADRLKAYELEEKFFNVQPGPADNAIFSSEPGTESIATKMARSGIKFTRGNKSPGSRVQGVQLLRGLLKAAATRPMEYPGIFVFKNCHHTIRTLPNLENDPKKPEDIDTTGEDHIYDVVRYRVLKAAKAAKKIVVTGT